MASLSLETQRLKIIPLSPKELALYTRQDCLLEKKLGLQLKQRVIAPELNEAIQEVLLPATQNNKNYLFSTLWSIILKDQKVMVGDLCFKGPPNEKGEIEIGYGTYEEFQKMGYMTEAIKAVLDWAWKNTEARVVLAETEKNNLPSHKILINNGFIPFHYEGEMVWWRIDKNKSS